MPVLIPKGYAGKILKRISNIEQGMSNYEVFLRHSLFLVRHSAVQKEYPSAEC